MSTSLVQTVLEIEREADAILAKAAQDAEKIIADAKAELETATRSSQDAAHKEIASLEERTATEKAKKVKELQDAGEQALSAVKNIADDKFDKGVAYIMNALKG
ncbi:MAG: hypothetical protein LIQ31_02450 [Planctomycetes bacterium]|nr:hypothetical protein [Planctomycetota bacterium]